MNNAFYIAATGLRSEQQALDVIAHNIANVNTTGFKRSQVQFSQMMGVPEADASGGAAVTPSVGAGVRVDGSSPTFTQGDLHPTGQALDLAIDGDGFIELMGPGGQTMLWRGGSLKVNADGYLASANDMPLKAMISVPAGTTQLTIDAGGQVRAQSAAGGSGSVIGQIDLVVPKDLTDLRAVSGGLFRTSTEARLTSAQPGQEGAGSLVQGSLESSNVQLSDEMVTLLLVQRAYAANAQVVQAGDQLMSIANGLRR